MRKTVMIAAACAALLLAGCDDLASVPQDPLMHPQTAAAPYSPPVKVLNKATMEETLNYAANIHDTMRRYRDVLLQTPSDTDAFYSRRSVLVDQDAQSDLRRCHRQGFPGRHRLASQIPGPARTQIITRRDS